MTMAKSILFDSVEMAMLQELAKRSRQKPDQYLKTLIKCQYDATKH
jgi:hypothetical protein